MSSPRYALYAGTVTSRTDQQLHYIPPATLARLYGVALADCIIVMPWDYERPDLRQKLEDARKLTALRPRYDGDYRLPPPRN